VIVKKIDSEPGCAHIFGLIITLPEKSFAILARTKESNSVGLIFE
jgi:hypothetical protein